MNHIKYSFLFFIKFVTVLLESSCTKLIPIDLEKSNARAESQG